MRDILCVYGSAQKILRTAFFPSFVFFLNAKMSPSHAKINNSKKNSGSRPLLSRPCEGRPNCSNFVVQIYFASYCLRRAINAKSKTKPWGPEIKLFRSKNLFPKDNIIKLNRKMLWRKYFLSYSIQSEISCEKGLFKNIICKIWSFKLDENRFTRCKNFSFFKIDFIATKLLSGGSRNLRPWSSWTFPSEKSRNGQLLNRPRPIRTVLNFKGRPFFFLIFRKKLMLS